MASTTSLIYIRPVLTWALPGSYPFLNQSYCSPLRIGISPAAAPLYPHAASLLNDAPDAASLLDDGPGIGWLLNDAPDVASLLDDGPGIGWLLNDAPNVASLLDDRLSMAALVHRNDSGLGNATGRQRSETEHQSRPRTLKDHVVSSSASDHRQTLHASLTPKGTRRLIERFKPRR